MSDLLAEIRARLDAWNEMQPVAQSLTHPDEYVADIAWLLDEVERLGRENADDLLEITRKASDAEDYWMQEARRLAVEVERLRLLVPCENCGEQGDSDECAYCGATAGAE